MIKYIKLFAFFGIFLLLSGCEGDVPYDAALFRPNPDNCWPCVMYMQAFIAIDKVLDGSLETISENSLAILKMALLIWLLLRITKVVFSFSMPDMKKELASFVTVLFKALIVAILLNNPTYIYDFFGGSIIQPLGDGFLSLAKVVLDAPSDMGIHVYYSDVSNWFSNFQDIVSRLTGGLFSSSSSTSSATTSKMFGELAVTVQKMVFEIYAALWSGVGLGFQLWTLKGISATLAGLLLMAGMFWLIIIIPLSFVDAFFRIGLILVLLPLLMVGWVFSYPDGIVKKLFHNLLAGFFDILFTCIYIAFIISLFRVYEAEEFPGMFSASMQVTEGSMRTEGDNFGTQFLILIMLTWTMVKLSSKIQDFAKYFFDSAAKTGVMEMINKFKNLAVKGIRLGATILSGPAGWVTGGATAAMGAVKDSIQQTNNKEEDNKNGDSQGAKSQDNSQKASAKRSAPPPKKGGK